MTIKGQLAILFAKKDLPMEQYRMLSEFQNLELETETIEKISKYNLPEITKMICGSEILLNMPWAEKYRSVASLYQNTESFDEMEVLAQYFNRPKYFENEILRFSDKTIILHFKQFFDDKQDELKGLKSTASKLNKKIKKYETTEKEEEEKTIEVANDSKEDEINLDNSQDSQANNVPVENDNSELDKYKKERDDVKQKIDKLSGDLKPWKEHIKLIEEYYQKVNNTENETDREKAYALLNSIRMPYEEEFLQEFIHTGVIPDEIYSKFKDKMFCSKVIQCLEKGSFKDCAFPILEKLYEEGVIDLEEEDFTQFIEDHLTQLSDFLVDMLQKSSDNITNSDLAVFFDIAIKTVVNAKDIQSIMSLSSVWNCLHKISDWEVLFKKISEMQPSNINFAISKFLVGVKGRAARAIVDYLMESFVPDVKYSIPDIISGLCSLEHFEEKELFINILCVLQQNNQKLKRKINISERKVNSQAQELFSSLYMPLEQLEELTVNLNQSDGTIGCALVSNKLMEIVSDLRDGLNAMGVLTLADIDDWRYGRNVDFNKDIHHSVVEISDNPGKVKLRTIGFKYQDDEGDWKVVTAEVYKPQKRVPKEQSQKKEESSNKCKKKESGSSSQNNKRSHHENRNKENMGQRKKSYDEKNNKKHVYSSSRRENCDNYRNNRYNDNKSSRSRGSKQKRKG